MAISILSAAPRSTPVGNVAYIHQAQLQEAQRIAATTAALNSLSMAGWHLTRNTGSVKQSIAKTEQALSYLRKLEGGAA
jgi:ABC-type transport system involved in Fe-S cluster assembly fused permease/ATPase subunit